jgi:hypothetical protein
MVLTMPVEGDWHSEFLQSSVAMTYGTHEDYPITYIAECK